MKGHLSLYFAALCLVAAACSTPTPTGASLTPSSPQPAPTPAAGQITTTIASGDPNGFAITIAYASPAVSTLPIYAAMDQGFFAQQHLNVTLLAMAANAQVAALNKGDLSFSSSPPNVAIGAVNGLPLKMLASLWTKSPWTVVGKSGLSGLPSLKGKVVAVTQPGTSPYIYLEAALKQNRMQLSDVTTIKAAGTQDIYAQLLSGQVDAAVLSPPFDTQAEAQGFQEVQFLGDALEVPYTGLAASGPFIADHRPQVVSTLRSLIDATKWLRAHPDGATALMVKYLSLDQPTASTVAQKAVPLLSETGEATHLGVQQLIDSELEPGVSTELTVDQFADYGPLREALAQQ